MKILKTSDADYINLDQVTRVECDPQQVTLHFDGEYQLAPRGGDAKKLPHFVAESASEAAGREPMR